MFTILPSLTAFLYSIGHKLGTSALVDSSVFRPLSFSGECDHSHRIWVSNCFRAFHRTVRVVVCPKLLYMPTETHRTYGLHLRSSSSAWQKGVTRFMRARQQAQADNNPANQQKPLTLFKLCLADEHCAAHDIRSVSDHERRFAKP